tara:strand:- start:1548 stop:2249 length:702 start_codon:yes stop_codon:yes gene_type:complete
MESIQSFDVDELPNSSFNIILGKRRSGKTVVAESIINQLVQARKLDCCFLFSPTDAGFDMIPRADRFSDLTHLHTIVNNYERMNTFNKVAPKRDKFKIRTLIVLDDMACSLKDIKNRILETLAVNGRHKAYEPLSLSFLILCQSLTKIPRVVRLNADNIFVNAIASRLEQDMVFDENLYVLDGTSDGRRQARNLYTDLTSSQDFIFVVIENWRQNCRCHADFLKTYVADYNGC